MPVLHSLRVMLKPPCNVFYHSHFITSSLHETKTIITIINTDYDTLYQLYCQVKNTLISNI
ncbi:hypothetical protein D081_0835 [Anaerovibrio sp. JC8]|nr:hypothetical protein D081_0835 [Anaerovibrio sp. JC8]